MASTVLSAPTEKVGIPDEQGESEPIRSLEKLADAVLKSEARWEEFHRALTEMSPSNRLVLRRWMWRGCNDSE